MSQSSHASSLLELLPPAPSVAAYITEIAVATGLYVIVWAGGKSAGAYACYVLTDHLPGPGNRVFEKGRVLLS